MGNRIRIDWSYLSNLRFADDIVLILSDVNELGELLEQQQCSKGDGLKQKGHQGSNIKSYQKKEVNRRTDLKSIWKATWYPKR